MMKFMMAALLASAVSAAAPDASGAPLAEFRASDNLNMDAASIEKEAAQAQGRMQEMFHDVRRLMYSYDFSSTCVSSLLACVEESDCGADETCYFSSSRKKRQLNAASEDSASRKLLFGSNAVGQCVCD